MGQKEELVKGINTLHGALVVGGVFFAGVSCVIAQQKLAVKLNDDSSFFKLLMAVGLVFGVIITFVAPIIFRAKLRPVIGLDSTYEKLNLYRSAFIVKLAMIEGAAFFNLVAMQLNGNLINLMMAGWLIVFMLMQKPTNPRISTDLALARFDDLTD